MPRHPPRVTPSHSLTFAPFLCKFYPCGPQTSSVQAAEEGLSRTPIGCCRSKQKVTISSQQERAELDSRARQGETVVHGGTGGRSLEAQEHLAEGRSRGGQTRREQLGTEGYQEMGRKGGLSTMDQSGGESAEKERIPIDESKFRTKS